MNLNKQLLLISSLLVRNSENVVFSEKLINKITQKDKEKLIKLNKETIPSLINSLNSPFSMKGCLNDNFNLFLNCEESKQTNI